MRVIDKDLKLALGRHGFETAWHLWRPTETQDRVADTDSHAARRGQRRHRVRDVESPDQWDAHQVTLAARVELIRGARKFRVIIRSAKIGTHSEAVGNNRDFFVEPIN